MIDDSLLDERIRGYDWEYAFQCCGAAEIQSIEDGSPVLACAHNEPSVSAALGSTAPANPFQRIDVTQVIATSDGENDGAHWIGVFLLYDGRYAFLSAGCDYTGWDCQSWGNAIVSHDLAHLVQFGLGQEDRDRLGLQVSP